jgi:hypothetical protein
MKRRRTSLEEIHQVADGENDHRHEEEGSARLHDREQSAEQYANNQALFDLEKLPQAGPDRALPRLVSDGQGSPRKTNAPPYPKPQRKSVTGRNCEARLRRRALRGPSAQQNEAETFAALRMTTAHKRPQMGANRCK